MIPAPPQFAGPLSEFFEKYVWPNSPSTERVMEFDQFLRSYLNSENPIHVLRTVKTLKRGVEFRNKGGYRILPTDNSPVWWLHAFLRTNAALPADPEKFFVSLPAHMFHLPRDVRYLNKFGFHAAHLVNAKNGDTDWQSWSRKELVRRTLVNIHPLNVFLIAKANWQKFGGHPQTLSWVSAQYLHRYGGVMRSFLSDVDVAYAHIPISIDQTYEFGTESTKTAKGGRYLGPSSPMKMHSSKRPIIKQVLVGTGTVMIIEASYGRFKISHDVLLAWVGEHLNALNTPSWTDLGVYHWPRPSKKMMSFLEDFRI
jgi:hypothetical protein